MSAIIGLASSGDVSSKMMGWAFKRGAVDSLSPMCADISTGLSLEDSNRISSVRIISHEGIDAFDSELATCVRPYSRRL